MTAIRGSTGAVLGYLHRAADFGPERLDLCESAALLQVAAKSAAAGHSSRPHHHHLPQRRETVGTAEAWIVLSGALRITVAEAAGHVPIWVDLGAGDCYVSIVGIHSLEVSADGTRFYEVKNGPYTGQAADKEWTK